MGEIDPDTLLPSERMREQAVAGDVTQIHRGQQYADVGDTFTVGETTFEIVEVTDRTLGDMTDADARAEGARDLAHYKEILEHAHDNFEWDDESEIVCHRFEPQ
ncbi:ASCH domain-containing protein [Halorientalis brevis]|uniref:ASCH domain-containing protein n=1 Tax=Halorientalis brevis TaxID=1126241 RepID=A0ABD6CEK1_9EURY|nr:ASCH domain-containing protein [Halorientalis brevis]